MATLTKASNEWAKRPDDESYDSLASLHAAAVTARERARTATAETETLRPINVGGTVALNASAYDEEPNAIPLSHWAFGQLARIAGAPADYLRSLPAPIVVDAITHGITHPTTNRDRLTKVLLDQNGTSKIRALTSTGYTRIFNSEVTERLVKLTQRYPAWQPAPAAMNGRRGLYLGDQDMFAFLVDNDRRVFEKGVEGGLGRGFFTWNSEVGSASFGICTFLYEYVCGNHIVWGAKAIREMRLRHVGDVDQRMVSTFEATVITYADSSPEDEEALIESARRYRIADTKDEVLDKVFGLRAPSLTRKLLTEAYDAAAERTDWYGDPRSAWGLTNGITQVSQRKAYANERNDIDRAAGRVLDLAFGR